jgi:amino acid permease
LIFNATEHLLSCFGWEIWHWAAAWVLPLLVFLNTTPLTYHRVEKIFCCLKIVALYGIVLSSVVWTAFLTTLPESTTIFNDNTSSAAALRQRPFSAMGRFIGAGRTLIHIMIWMSIIIWGWVGIKNTSDPQLFEITPDRDLLSNSVTLSWSVEHVAVDKLEKTDFARHKSLLGETRSACLRFLLGYTLAFSLIGLNVAYHDSSTMDLVSNLAWLKDRSPFTLAIEGRLRALLYLINAFAILSAISTANTALYVSPQILYSLARVESRWPRWSWTHPFMNRLRKTVTRGVPLFAVMITLLYGGLLLALAGYGSAAVIEKRLIQGSVLYFPNPDGFGAEEYPLPRGKIAHIIQIYRENT